MDEIFKVLPAWFTTVLLPASVGLCVIIGTVWKMREYFFKEPSQHADLGPVIAQLIKPRNHGEGEATPLWRQLELLGGRQNNLEANLFELTKNNLKIAEDVWKVQTAQVDLRHDTVALRSEIATIRDDNSIIKHDTTEIKEILKKKKG